MDVGIISEGIEHLVILLDSQDLNVLINLVSKESLWIINALIFIRARVTKI